MPLWVASLFADVSVDRRYQLGEGSGENGAAGAVVGSNNTVGSADTLDDIGPSGAFIDLFQVGNPTYVDVFSGANARTGTSSGDLGVQFDGSNFLRGVPLNRPDRVVDRLPSYPIDYTDIRGHGMQMWVYPDQAGLDAGTYQSVVFDTIQSGGPAIDGSGNWTQSNSGHTNTDPVPASIPVVGDTWYHVMHHHYPLGLAGDNFVSVVFVDGIAVSANEDVIGNPDDTLYTGDLVVGALEQPNDGLTPLYGEFFQGAVDELDLYVYGSNGSANYGDFNLMLDNLWINDQIGGSLLAADVNLDGTVNGDGSGDPASDDVAAFVDGWRRNKTFAGAHGDVTVGDFETWGWGDLNLDGTVNFADWHILRANHPNGANLDLASLVPEPHYGVIFVGGLLPILTFRRRR